MRAARMGRRGWLPLLLCLSLGAQGQNVSSQTLSVKWIPQHVVLSGYWLEVEHRWNQHPRQSFTFTPQLYAGPTGRPDGVATFRPDQNETVRGAGFQVQHRWYLSATEAPYPSGL